MPPAPPTRAPKLTPAPSLTTNPPNQPNQKKQQVIKKVREHHRKKRKEARKEAAKPGAARRARIQAIKSDPGLPSQWPFREELVKEFAWERQRILLAERERKEARKAARLEQTQQQLADLGAQAARRAADHEAAGGGADADDGGGSRKRNRSSSTATATANDPDASRRAFYREFRRVVELSDVVIQVLDARDPEGCRCRDVERLVRASGAHKRVVLLLNKADLVPRAALEAWLARLRLELPTVAFKASTQQQASGLGQRAGGLAGKKRGGNSGGSAAQAAQAAAAAADGAVGAGALGAACLGADTLLQLIKNYARNAGAGGGGGGSKGGGAGGVRSAVTVGVVGLPNVGKSSVINSLRRARVAAVGDTPGMTRTAQIVQLDKHIRLVDSPGVVFAGIGGGGGGVDGGDEDRARAAAAAALRNAARVEKLEDPIAPVAEIVRRVPAKRLMALYRVAAFDAALVEAEKKASGAGGKKAKKGASSSSSLPHEAYVAAADRFLQLVAQARGKLRRGGVPDVGAAARLVLGDWCAGRIPYYTLPPAIAASLSAEDAAHESAQIVSGWSAEFDAERVFADERRVVLERLPAPAAAAGDGGLLGGDDDAAAGGGAFVEVAAAGSAPRLDVAAMEEGSDGEDDDDDEEDGMDEGDEDDDENGGLDAATAALLARRQRAAEGGAGGAGHAAQRAQLYSAEGQRDPHALRAEKKRQKRVKAALKGIGGGGGEGGGDDDFDFDEANEKEGLVEYGDDEEDGDGKDADARYLDRMEGADD
jgi:nuclear GTP-binding protein